MRLPLSSVVYQVKGSLTWNTPLKSLTLGLPWTTPQPLAEIVLTKDKIILRSLGLDKYAFTKNEVNVKPVFDISAFFGIKFVHTRAEYPKKIVFGWFSESDRDRCLAQLTQMGVSSIE